MDFGFLRAYEAQRVVSYTPQPPLLDPPEGDDDQPSQIDLDVEVEAGAWRPRPIAVPHGWRVGDWEERPDRFVDGKDVGETIAWLRAPGGYPVPVRLSEIGGVAVRLMGGAVRREFAVVERVVSMAVDPFPWNEVEEFAATLQSIGFRLLPAELPGDPPAASFDFEVMRRSAQFRSNTEMGVLEEAALAQDKTVPTIVDGPLEPRAGGLDQDRSPAVGLIKSHYRNYLHPIGLELLYRLEPGERTPLFALPEARFPVVSWYLRLAGVRGATPNWGIVRLELPLRWWRELGDARMQYVGYVSQLVREYRSRSELYARAPVSLHPIVRAEELLGALFTPASVLAARFYRLTGL